MNTVRPGNKVFVGSSDALELCLCYRALPKMDNIELMSTDTKFVGERMDIPLHSCIFGTYSGVCR